MVNPDLLKKGDTLWLASFEEGVPEASGLLEVEVLGVRPEGIRNRVVFRIKSNSKTYVVEPDQLFPVGQEAAAYVRLATLAGDAMTELKHVLAEWRRRVDHWGQGRPFPDDMEVPNDGEPERGEGG